MRLPGLAERLFDHGRRMAGKSRQADELRLDIRRVYLLPTRAGLFFGLSAVAMLLYAVNFGLALAYALAFLWVGVGLVAMVRTWRNLVGVRIRPLGTTPAFAGGKAGFHFSLRADDPRPALRLWADGDEVTLDLGHDARASLWLPVSERGTYAPKRIVATTEYPLGLFRAFAFLDFDLRALVYPRPAALAPGHASGSGQKGDTPVSLEGDDFAGLRPWVPADSPRQVAWKPSARSDTLLSKRYARDAGPPVVLAWEETPGEAETRLSRLCRGLLDAAAQGRPWILRLPGEVHEGNASPTDLERCLRALALFRVPTPGAP